MVAAVVLKQSAYFLYGIFAFLVLFMIFFTLHNIRKRVGGPAPWLQWIWIAGLAGAVLCGGLFAVTEAAQKANAVPRTLELTGIQGIGFSPDGKRLLVSSAEGMHEYANQVWNKTIVGSHRYAGFSIVDNGYYASGRPGEGISLKDPLGVVRSLDNGRTLDILDLYGEANFSLLAAGYRSHVLYVVNSKPNARMEQPGLYHSLNDAATWNQVAMNGVYGDLYAIAAHPTASGTVAVATETGVFVSDDAGSRFEQIAFKVQATAVAFDSSGQLLAAGFMDGKPKLFRLSRESGKMDMMALPQLAGGDGVAYIAQNAASPNELAVATAAKDVYRSADNGRTWLRIAEKGRTLDQDTEKR